MSDKKTTVHEAIADALAAHGTDSLFALMGDANLFLVESLVRRHKVDLVPFAHEAGVVLAAVAYASVSGRVGVATVTHGPALTNCLTALIEGTRAQLPVVLLAGDTPVEAVHNPQNVDQREIVKSSGAGFEQMRSPATAVEDVATAFYRARVERRPIVLNMPSDFMWQHVESKTVVHPVFETPSMVPEGTHMEEAIGMLASARRPLIVAGRGAVSSKDKIIALAERLEAPLATTLQAKDLFVGHPANIGVFGTLSTEGAYEIMARSDCVVSFGTHMNIFHTDRGNLLEGKRTIQINHAANVIGEMFRPDVALVADAGLTAENFLHWMEETETPPSGFSKEIEAETVPFHAKSTGTGTSEGFVDFPAALDRLDAILPRERLLVTDGGQFVTEVWCRFGVQHPHHFVYSTRFASIGLGLQMAIGASQAAPEKLTVLFTGDGGFMSGGLTEFNTAVRKNQRLLVIVCNDSAYGAEYIQFTDRQLDPTLSTFNWPSFADVANALGGRGMRVSSLDELDGVGKFLEDMDGPALIDIKLDAANVPRMRL
ncbi:MAG: thiamine pyrophosphate-binding protein [Pseudomonadota bacterium]